jgi:IS30 family transposase
MSYQHINAKERHTLMFLHQMNLSNREIGRRLGRCHTTIGREIKRNTLFSGYCDTQAHKLASKRRKEPRHKLKRSNTVLKEYVIDQLRKDWSPETISGRLVIDFPRSTQMRISPETVYQWIYNDAENGGDLYVHLIRRHRKRRKQMPYGTGRGFIPGRVNISERPVSIENRSRFGHWEGDSVLGAKGTGGIATHVERKSRLLIASKLKDQRSDTFTNATNRAFNAIPKNWKKTLTVDNGKEFSGFKDIESNTEMDVYFCDPYSPWQRGTNENTNGLLRHYFPKGIDWHTVNRKELARVVDKLNNRPRKCLNYQTPNEVFLKSTSGALTS